jgi:circadian clock protein KaiC
MCNRNERCLYFAFEESPDQIVRNMRSVGIDLQPHLDSGLLRIDSSRPSLYGLEMHLNLMNREIQRFKPSAVIIDPISAFRGPETEVHASLLRMVDILKSNGITGIFTNLLKGQGQLEDEYGHGMSSLMDTWLYLTNLEANGERNRGLYILKSRGMNHSNQIREYQITGQGVKLIEVYIGFEGVLTGSARLAQEAKEQAEVVRRKQDIERRKREFETRRKTLELQLSEIQTTMEMEEAELKAITRQAEELERMLQLDRAAMATNRGIKNGK